MEATGFSEKFDELKATLEKAIRKDYNIFKNPEISLLKFSENIICRVDDKAGTQSAVLRVSRPGYHDFTELENELKWIMQINNETDIHTAEVFPGVDGKALQSFVSAGGNSYTYSLQSFLKGIPLRQISNENRDEQLEKVGCIAAKLHRMEEHMPHDYIEFRRFTWDIADTLREGARWGHFLAFQGLTTQEHRLFEKAGARIEERLNRYGRSPQNYGLIHADLHSENLLVDREEISLIDFDDCGYSWYLYDLASAVSQQSDGLGDMVRAYLKGYQNIRKLAKEDLEEIDTFLLLRRFVRLGWMASHSDNGVLLREGETYLRVTKALAEGYLKDISLI